MKALKVVALIVAGVAVLLAIVVVLALTPSVQTWAVHKALADQPGLTAKFGRVAAGLSDAKIDDVRIVKDGAVITAKGITANYSAWDYISNKRVNVDQLTVSELLVDLRNAQPAAGTAAPGSSPASAGASGSSSASGTTAASSGSPGAQPKAGTPARPATAGAPAEKSEPFKGLLSQAELPLDVRVAKFDVKGRALLPADQQADFSLQGSNIATGQKGQIEWKVDFVDKTAGSPLQALRSTGTAGIRIASDRRIDLVEVDATASADGPSLPKDRVKLTARLEQPKAGANESYRVNVGLDRGAQVESLLGATAEFVTAQREFTGGWELAVRTEQLAALLAGLGLPEVALRGTGKFAFKPDTGAASGSGELQGQVSALEKISPELKPIGSMSFKTGFDGGLADNNARLERFQLEASTADGRKLAQINTAQRVGFHLETKKVTIADPKSELARVSVQALPLAWAQPFAKGVTIDSGDLSLLLAVDAEADGSRVRVRSVEPLALRAVTVRSGETKLVEQLNFTARPSIDYSATRIVAELAELNLALPAGDTLGGRLGAEVTELAQKTPRIAFTSDLRAKVVAALRPYLPLDPGPLTAQITSEGRLQGDVLYLAKASATVNRDNGVLLTSLELQQPVTANLAQSTATVPKPEAAAARVQLGEVPLAWAEKFVEKSKFAGTLSGVTLEVAFRTVEDVTLTTTQPLVVRGATVSLEGKPMVQTLDMTAELTATKRGTTIAYDLRRLEIGQGNAALAKLNTSGEAQMKEKLTLVAKGNLDADVAALMRQPAAAGFATLSRGRLTTAFEANVGETIQAKATVGARGLVARQNNQSLGDLDLTVTATMKPDGSGSVLMPVALTNANRKSDVLVEATFGQASDKKTFLFAGKVSGNQLFVDDFQPLAALAPAGDKPATPAAKPGRDTQPFWAGAQGKLQLDLKRVVSGPAYVVSPLRGTVTVSQNRIALDGLEGRFNENPFKTSAAITFNAQQAKPYSLTGSADVSNFDLAAILRAANPNEKPAIESKVTVLARLNGNGANIGDLMKGVYGQFDLTGSKGVLRALGKKGQTVSTMSTIVGIIGAARGSNTTMAVAELAQAFNELTFDSFTMKVERAADLSLKVSSIEFISPLMRTTGSGGIANRGDQPIGNQPMEFTLQFGAKDNLAALLNKAGVLAGQQDEKGYYLMSQRFTIGGTPANPDSTPLWQIIGAAAARAAAGSLLR